MCPTYTQCLSAADDDDKENDEFKISREASSNYK